MKKKRYYRFLILQFLAVLFVFLSINKPQVWAVTLEERVEALENQVNFPIGYIYISTSSKNPGTVFGGVWQKIADGRCLLSVNKSRDSGETGGTKTETLSIDQIPAHQHTATTNNAGNHSHTFAIKSNSDELQGGYSGRAIGSTSGMWYGGRIGFINTGLTSNTSSMSTTHKHTTTTSSAGGGEAHNNLQPYYTAYIWTRVA